jgi:type III restriction enzyme
MNRHVNAIAGRLSLRQPQRRSLEILDRITEIVPPKKGGDVRAALDAVCSEFSSVNSRRCASPWPQVSERRV